MPLLSFATNGDGSAGRNFIIHNRPFYINTDRIVVKPRRDDLDVRYIRVMLQGIKERYGFNHAHKANAHNLSVVSFDVPIKADNTFDIEQQHIAIEIADYLEELRAAINAQKKRVLEAQVEIDLSGYRFGYKKVSDLFSILRGSGIYTKSYTNSHKGSIPLFSGNTSGAFAYVDTADYDTPCLSWAIDGLAGYIMVHTSAFSATNHRGILLPKTKIINLQYAQFSMQAIFRNAKKSRIGDNGENEYTSLPPFMVQNLQVPFPLDDNGEMSVSAQEEIGPKVFSY